MRQLISRLAFLIRFGYAFEALLLCIGRLGVPGLGPAIAITQIPAIAWALGVPPPEVAPNGQRDMFAFMFVVQGFIFSVIAIGVWFMVRPRKANHLATK